MSKGGALQKVKQLLNSVGIKAPWKVRSDINSRPVRLTARLGGRWVGQAVGVGPGVRACFSATQLAQPCRMHCSAVLACMCIVVVV